MTKASDIKDRFAGIEIKITRQDHTSIYGIVSLWDDDGNVLYLRSHGSIEQINYDDIEDIIESDGLEPKELLPKKVVRTARKEENFPSLFKRLAAKGRI
jgi:hypothetical protein